MDLAFRLCFQQFQTIFDRIKTKLHVSVATGTNQQMQSKYVKHPKAKAIQSPVR